MAFVSELLANLVFVAIPYILHRNGLATEHFPMERRTSPLESLPDETLTQVLAYLEWYEILQVRQCCRRLDRVSKDRSVWLAVLLRYYDTALPRPFLLPKPLRYCSSSDLERIVCNWFSVRGLADPDLAQKKEVTPPDTWPRGFALGPLPGGRVFMHATPDGNIHCHDIENLGNPASLFIPTPFPSYTESSHGIITRMSMDILTTQADGIPTEDRLFPSTFSLAAIWEAHNIVNLSEAPLRVFGVYQVEVQLGEDGSVAGYTAVQLALIRERAPQDALLGECSLYGSNLAYHSQVGCRRAIVIVDWTSIPHLTSAKYPRVYLPDIHPAEFSLLPGKHISVLQDRAVLIYNWGAVHPKAHPPDPRLLRRLLPALPKWKTTLPSFGGAFPPLSPYLFNDTVRLIVPTSVGLKGIVIPLRFLTQVSDSEAIVSPSESHPTTVLLIDRDFGCADGLSFGFRKGISADYPDTHVWQYGWPDEMQTGTLKVYSLPSHVYGAATALTIHCIEQKNRLVSVLESQCQIIDF
ncbi:hypothetical protein CC1G_08796 [Coprinopsis cinerea okayama7|uniref:F-box domain-containing protein n=1 Tax=Coprinopsis cinerea (strain Okayama-7 / 130 / ATCC MYA-4618 / FGSC 9003) TaxID=240176 RepID=A8N446_COPC7|nr:hypothetical protein CC1G_08796 [Coprinopsis cinerea okayama7\|eukprot:XP_001829641.2 hypothetical protein CC1G_08796 [Coprinopsis cinerea okayama7\